MLSDVLSSAVADANVPDAFKHAGNWQKLIAQTESRLAEGWRERFSGERPRTEEAESLDLLPDDEHDQQILSERFANDLSEQMRKPLDQLDRQLAALSGDGLTDRSNNPLGPTAWADGIRGGMRVMDCTPAERDWLMQRLLPLLASRMGMFYSNVAAALPGGRGGHQGQGQVKLAGGEAQARVPQYQPEMVESIAPRLDGPTPSAGQFSDSQNTDVVSRLFGLLGAQRGQIGNGGAGPASGWAHGAGGFGGGAGSGGGGFSGFGGGVANNGEGFAGFSSGVGDAGGAAGATWSQADLSSVLALLQSSYSAAGSPNGSMVGLQQAMNSTAQQLGLPAGVQAIPAPARDMLELVNMLFDVLLDGRRLDERARSQLSRLVIPYVRMAVLDKHLFMQSTHPARRVLNLLVEAFETAGPDVPHYAALREIGFTVVGRIVDEFADDLALFDELEKLLSKELQSGRRRAELAERRAGDAQAGRERRQAARDSVVRLLRGSISDKKLPRELLEFLAGPWQHHHVVLTLREGEDGSAIRASLSLLEELILHAEVGSLGDPASLRIRLTDVLASSGHLDDVDDVIANLAAAIAAASVAPEDPVELLPVRQAMIEKLIAPEPVVVAEDEYLVPETVSADLPVDIVVAYREAAIGTWLDFIGEDGRVTAARISWTSPISGRRIISNRRGQRMLVASPEELAEMETEGRLRIRESEAAFDRALSTLTRRLEQSSSQAQAG